MTSTACLPQDTTFFALLDQTPQLDRRDPRGRKHALSLVLTGLLVALLARRDGNLSSMHRHMTNHFGALCQRLYLVGQQVISRPQLPRLLALVNAPLLTQLLLDRFDIVLTDRQLDWFGVDGKELRGSMAKAQQRGQACVSVVAHLTEQVMAQTYYDGYKQSERPTVANLLLDKGLLKNKLTLDALHLTPTLTAGIHLARGSYVIGLKANQPHLQRACIIQTLLYTPRFERVDAPERKHGRVDERQYVCYGMPTLGKASRWQASGLCTLVVVRRIRKTLLGKELSRHISYFVSNVSVADTTQACALYDAIRRHWRIETMHYRRDVVLAEDGLRSQQVGVQQALSGLRTLVLNLLGQSRVKNMAAQLDEFADNIQFLFDFLKLKRVL